MWSLLIIWTVGPNIHIIWRLLLVRNRSSMRSWAAWVAKILDLLYSQTLHHYWLIGILCQWVDTGALLWILINGCQWSFWFNQIQKHPLCSTDYLSHIEIFFQMFISCRTLSDNSSNRISLSHLHYFASIHSKNSGLSCIADQ